MNDLAGEQFHHLRQHILHELIDLGIADAEHILIHAPVVSHLIGTARTTELRIRGERRQHVSGHVYLRYDGDMPCCGVRHNVAYLLLCIVAAIRCLVVKVGIRADDRTATLGTYGDQLRPFLDFDAPALIISEVPVKHVHIMQRQQVDELLDKIH